MAVPFDFGSAMGNLITNPQDILEVEENITFELSGRSVSAHIIDEIFSTGIFLFFMGRPLDTFYSILYCLLE